MRFAVIQPRMIRHVPLWLIGWVEIHIFIPSGFQRTHKSGGVFRGVHTRLTDTRREMKLCVWKKTVKMLFNATHAIGIPSVKRRNSRGRVLNFNYRVEIENPRIITGFERQLPGCACTAIKGIPLTELVKDNLLNHQLGYSSLGLWPAAEDNRLGIVSSRGRCWTKGFCSSTHTFS